MLGYSSNVFITEIVKAQQHVTSKSRMWVTAGSWRKRGGRMEGVRL